MRGRRYTGVMFAASYASWREVGLVDEWPRVFVYIGPYGL